MDDSALILIASHGALMRAVLGSLDGTPQNEISDWRPRNCEWVEREVSRFQWAGLFSRLAAGRADGDWVRGGLSDE